ncbi:RING/U-box superfamily protein [Thalictrum thalictroides]|uniref:RING/U-box superfamily protein n=1 Tax=Thalictrum thalictroides TaxID=46969 RepID=A0A7J6VGI1_THATH|nr:RING/U-box superfamily protein [Thalictrum thalictroides]KAF5183812.1 RING/U-box superfamily protein [Thalictrum thalictroides]
MSVLDHSNLRDLLRVRDNEDDGRDSLAGLTLAAVLGCEATISRRPSRTLLDIIKDEESGAAYRGLTPPTDANKNSWKSFKSRLRLRRAGAAFSSSTSSNPIDACDISIEGCNIRISPPVLVDRPRLLRNITFNHGRNSYSSSNSPIFSPRANSSTRAESSETGQEEERPERELNSTSNPVEERPVIEIGVNLTENPAEHEHMPQSEVVMNLTESPAERGGNAGEETEVAPPRVSLMALLEETDWNVGRIGGSTVMDIDEMDEELEGDNKDLVEGGNDGVGEYVCCVCMVRHKGAAFIPCGHTFCRLCSRELWVNRGNCPLCNGFIQEILDIF